MSEPNAEYAWSRRTQEIYDLMSMGFDVDRARDIVDNDIKAAQIDRSEGENG